jgi:hypothetical protein
METQHTVLWSVSLSNGDTIHEEKGEYVTQAGLLSPWQRLLLFLEKEKLLVTSLSLYSNDGRRWNIPSAGKNPKFKAFAEAPKPVSYRMFRRMGGDVIGTGEITHKEIFTVAEAKYESGVVLQVWVDNATGNSWTLIV